MAIGSQRHLVTLENPSDPVPDGDGGFTEGWAPLDPPDWDCSIQPATARDLERLVGGTVQATATHLVRGRYHPQITIETRMTFKGRQLLVQNVTNVDERDIDLILVCAETIHGTQQAGTSRPRRVTRGPAAVTRGLSD